MATTVDAKLLRATKFPPEFNQKVDMQKVNLDLMKKWVSVTRYFVQLLTNFLIDGLQGKFQNCLVVKTM